MHRFSNLWKHPRTSAAGLLISIATVAGILSQQGVSLGHVGGGTVVSLAGALATALLGLLARDPGNSSPTPEPSNAGSTGAAKPAASSSTAKLSAWLLIALLLPLPWLEGCTNHEVAQNIVNWTPSLQSAVATVDSTAAVLDPAAAAAFASATAGFDAASNLLAMQAKAYLTNPTASTLAQLQAQVVLFEQQVDASLLAAARIVNPVSQRHAMAALQAVATIVSAMLALVQSISSKAQVARMASAAPIKMAAVRPYRDSSRAADLLAAHYAESPTRAAQQIEAAEALQTAAGF